MKRFAVLMFLLAACNPASEKTTTESTPPKAGAPQATQATAVFCADPKQSAPCWVLPHDVTPGSFGYATTKMQQTVQVKFDNFSWQSFVALNWPANSDGTANKTAQLTSDQNVIRVWDLYKDVDEIFLPGGAQPDLNYPSTSAPPTIPAICKQNNLGAGGKPVRVVRQAAKIDHFTNIPDSMTEAAVDVPLIDSNGNFVVYSVAVNRDEFEYIVDPQNQFYNASKQTKPANFPAGANGGIEGAIETKSSWKILTDAEKTSGSYITRMLQIYVPATQSASGAEFCTPPMTFGLIGLHIVHKTSTETDWIWSTFEHVNNAPLSSTPLPAEATQPSGGCAPPTGASLMSLYNPQCVTPEGTPCPLNQPPVQPKQNFIWQTSQPYAKQYLTSGKYGTQVVRCSAIYDAQPDGTQALNAQWQAKLPAPYSNYMLIGSQWFDSGEPTPPPTGTQAPASGGGENPAFPAGSIAAPPLLANATAETYLQNGTVLPGFDVASCLGCHTFAQGHGGYYADFSFILERAQGATSEQQAALRQRVAEVDKALAARR